MEEILLIYWWEWQILSLKQSGRLSCDRKEVLCTDLKRKCTLLLNFCATFFSFLRCGQEGMLSYLFSLLCILYLHDGVLKQQCDLLQSQEQH